MKPLIGTIRAVPGTATLAQEPGVEVSEASPILERHQALAMTGFLRRGGGRWARDERAMAFLHFVPMVLDGQPMMIAQLDYPRAGIGASILIDHKSATILNDSLRVTLDVLDAEVPPSVSPPPPSCEGGGDPPADPDQQGE